MPRSLFTHSTVGKGSLLAGISTRILHPDFSAADEQIAVLLRSHLRHGTKRLLADVTGQTLRHISAQLGGESGLRHKTVQGGVWLLSQDAEAEAVAGAIALIRDGVDGFALRERTGIVIEFKDGQLCLPGVR